MGTNTRRNSASIVQELSSNGPQYNVWQALWIAENYSSKLYPNRNDYIFEQTGIRLRPYERYEYPPSDIKSISFSDGYFTFVLTFMGLYGVNSPLPRCYHDHVDLQQRILGPGNVPLQNFYDMFNNRFYWLYYQSWKKYRFHLHINRTENDKVVERVKSFSGMRFLGNEKKSSISEYAFLKFSGLLSQRVRNKEGLQILLNHILPNFKMSVFEYIPRSIELQDAPLLGQFDNKLGENYFIGKYTIDYSSRICIEIGPIDFEDYFDFLPGKKYSNKLTELLNLYLSDGLEFDFSFKIKSETIVSVSWNDNRLRLGSTLWLGKPKKDLVNVYLHYEEIVPYN